jgi:hypothetical protein
MGGLGHDARFGKVAISNLWRICSFGYYHTALGCCIFTGKSNSIKL